MNGAGRFGRGVAGNTSGERELFEEALHAAAVASDVGVELRVRAFQPRIGDHTGSAVSGTANVDHVEIVFANDAIAVDIDKVQARSSAPVAEQARLDVLVLERFGEKWIVEQ